MDHRNENLPGARICVCLVSFCYISATTQKKLHELAQTGLDVHLITMAQWSYSLYKMQFRPAFSSYTPHVLPIYLSGIQGGYFFSPLRYYRLLKSLHPSVLHIDAEPFAIAALHAAIYARLLRIPLTMFVWENTDRYLWKSDESGKRLFFVRILMRQFVLSTVKHFCCGNAEAGQLLRKWGYCGELTVVPQFGVDIDDYPRRDVEPDDEEFVLGYVGRLIPEKGINTLIRAAAILKGQGVPVKLRIVGKGPQEEKLRQLAAELGLTELVDFYGPVSDKQVAQVMAAFHVLVLPSRTTPTWKEQFGKVLVEAMVIGVPVMGSRSGEIPTLIADERQTFDEGDAENLAAKLLVLQRDKALRVALAARNQDHVAKFYAQDVVARRYRQIWERVVSACI